MKKVLLKFVAIGGLALSIFSCSNDADNSDIIKLAAVNSADTAETVETGVVRAVKNSSSSTAVATLYSDLNPGYGSAVYFTGSFCNWKTAFRGDYSKKDGWHISIETDEVFVLIKGNASLFIGEDEERYDMETGKFYNVKKGAWHSMSMTENSIVLIVENDNTGLENTEYRPLKSKG